jgi:four helix bundle protein
VKNFRDLQVWRKAHEPTLQAYRVTTSFPREELYGLTGQTRQCAASIAAKIAEGCGKRGNAEFQRLLNIATGSASKLAYHFLLARDLSFMSEGEYSRLQGCGHRGETNAGITGSKGRIRTFGGLNSDC